MRKAIYMLALAALSFGAAAQTIPVPAIPDHLSKARDLYDAGRWAAAEYELGKALATPETETLDALCAARLGRPDAGMRLRRLLNEYPASPYGDRMRFAVGVLDHDAGRWDEANEMFAATDPRRLSAAERGEFHFKSAHTLFEEGDYAGARAGFALVSGESDYALHADYYLAYMDYAEGNYPAAKRAFTHLASTPSYAELAPYYLLQIAFLEGDYAYVTANAPELIAAAAMPRKAELIRMAAQSWFRLGDYAKALGNMEAYRSLGGEMGRAENYLAGFSLYRQGRLEDAARHLAEATGADDSLSQNASYHLADAYLRLGEQARALQSFSIAAASGHNPAIAEDALFNYGKLLYETGGGRFNEAVNVLGRYIAQYPGPSPRASEAREYLIAAYYNSRDYEAAYNAIVQHPDPDNDVLAALQKILYFRALERWRTGDAEGALTLLDASSAHRYATKYTALTSLWQGEILYSMGDYAAAIPKYEEYLRLSPTSELENRLARYNLGYAHFNLGGWERSGEWFDDFLERWPASDSYRADALNRRGDVEHAGRGYWRAIERYDAAAALGTPEKYYSAYQRALMLGLVDRSDRKIESLQAIIDAGEGDWVEEATYELGRTYISRDDYSEGARTLTAFIADYPDSRHYLSALSGLALAWLNMGDRQQSMKYYKMIVEQAPRSREARDAMAGIRGLYVDAGDVDGYFAWAQGAQVPTDLGEMQRDSLSFAAAERVYLSGDGPAAITSLENYIRGDQRGEYIPRALNYLSGLYFAAERWDEAADAYRRLVELSADDAVIRARAQDGLEKSSRRSALARATLLRGEGKGAEAVEIYRTLAGDPHTPEGAEAALRVIEYLHDSGDDGAAEDAIFAFAESDTPHSRRLGEAFLILGDIYIVRGDTFQARATLQSIVDGYSPPDDGIVAAAREKIANLK